MNIFLWHDNNDNGSYDPADGETPIAQGTFGNGLVLPINDSTTGTGPETTGSTQYVGAAWCAGTITVDNTTGVITCDGSSMGNAAQNESLTADLTFYATQARNQPNFQCSSLTP
jgi:hypothetical protein